MKNKFGHKFVGDDGSYGHNLKCIRCGIRVIYIKDDCVLYQKNIAHDKEELDITCNEYIIKNIIE